MRKLISYCSDFANFFNKVIIENFPFFKESQPETEINEFELSSRVYPSGQNKPNDLDMLMYFKTHSSIGRDPPRELY